MALSWVREQFAVKLALDAHPGTFNVRLVEPDDLALWRVIGERPGIEIEPPDRSACVARCYPVLVNDQLEGAIILPHVPGYAPDQVEVIAATSVREALGLADGDPVTLRIMGPRS
jgi:CTP-dependent riboflavin kinase